MDKLFKTIGTIILFSTFAILLSSCNSKTSIISSEPVNKSQSLTNEKFNIEYLKRIDLESNEHSIVFLDDSNMLIDKRSTDSEESHDYYKLNIDTKEKSKFTDIDGEFKDHPGSHNQNDNLLYTKDFKLMSYNINTKEKSELYDLSYIKEIVQGDYIINTDFELNCKIEYNYIPGSNNYVYIYIEKAGTSFGKVIFIDVSSKKAIESEWIHSSTYYGFLINPSDNLLYMGDRKGTFFSCDIESSFKNDKLNLNTLKEGVYYNSSYKYITKDGRILIGEYKFTTKLPEKPIKMYNIKSGQWEQIKGIDWYNIKANEDIFVDGYNSKSGIICMSKTCVDSHDIQNTSEYIGILYENSYKTLYTLKNDDDVTYVSPMNFINYNKNNSIISIERFCKDSSGNELSYIELFKIIPIT